MFAAVVLALLVAPCACVLIRVRLASGLVERLEVREDEAVDGLRGLLEQRGLMARSDSLLHRQRNVTHLAESFGSLQVKAGEIFEVLAAPVDPSSDLSQRTSDSQSPVTTRHKRVKSSRIASIADINARKAKLLKITRQKLSHEVMVHVSPSLSKAAPHASLPPPPPPSSSSV